jgi:hypothetical protein
MRDNVEREVEFVGVRDARIFRGPGLSGHAGEEACKRSSTFGFGVSRVCFDVEEKTSRDEGCGGIVIAAVYCPDRSLKGET